MSKELKHKLDIQFFSDDKGDDNGGSKPTFDEILADKEYQAEFDRRVQKAVITRTGKLQEKHKQELEEIKSSLSLNESEKKQFDQLQTQYENEKQEWESKLVETTKNSALELIITKSGTKDPVALKAHISKFITDAEFKDGQFVGLEEHIAERKNSDLVHLFGTEQPTGNPIGTPPKKETLQDLVEKQMGIKTK